MIEKLRRDFSDELEELGLELDEETIRRALRGYLARRLRRKERRESMTSAEKKAHRRRRRDEKRRQRARERRARALGVA